MINLFFVFFALILSVLVSSAIFWNLLNKKISLWESIKLVSIATSLNRLILTGSGYAAMSYKLKRDHLPLHKSVSSFIALELFLMFPWLVLGVYFGFNIAVKVPVFFAAFLALALIFAIYKRHKAASFAKEAWLHLREAKLNIFAISPLVLAHLFLGVVYYYCLLEAFGFTLSLTDILKIATVSVAIGYFSPSPGGLGFKESGLVFLLMQKGLSLKSSISVAVTDRVLVTGFYLIFGLIFGGKLILKEISSRLQRSKE